MATDKLVDFDHVTDYISREAALACFHDWIDRYGHEHTADEMVEYQRIEELPAADVRPVVRGEWKKAYADHEGFGVRPFYRYCSKCHEASVHQYNFCPNCGADMREETDG